MTFWNLLTLICLDQISSLYTNIVYTAYFIEISIVSHFSILRKKKYPFFLLCKTGEWALVKCRQLITICGKSGIFSLVLHNLFIFLQVLLYIIVANKFLFLDRFFFNSFESKFFKSLKNSKLSWNFQTNFIWK